MKAHHHAIRGLAIFGGLTILKIKIALGIIGLFISKAAVEELIDARFPNSKARFIIGAILVIYGFYPYIKKKIMGGYK